MSLNHALIIGLEKYLSSEIIQIEYAENDAKGIHDALKDLDYDPENTTLLVNQNATKTMIEFHCKRISRMLKKGDMMTIFFAGHGYFSDDDNYIVCHDTQPGDLKGTSISISGLTSRFVNSCNLILYLDIHSDCFTTVEMPGESYSNLNVTLLNESLSNPGYHTAGFLSSDTGECSHPLPASKHGVWTYHLIRALTGNAKEALEENKFLTASSLHDYLQKSVPLSLKESFTVPKIQTPVRSGKFQPDFLIADLHDLLQREKYSIKVNSNVSLEFCKRHSGRIKKLSGFKKTHIEPTEFNSSTQAFVKNISRNEINERTASLYGLIKSGFNLKQKEITSNNNGSFSTILTRDFEMDISLEQDDVSPNEYHEIIMLKNIGNPELIFDESFNRVFNSCFDTLTMHSFIIVEDFIDAVEEMESGDISIVYPPDISHACIDIKGIDGSVFVYDDRLEIKFNCNKEPRKFFETFMDINKYLSVNKCKFNLLK